jgi:hypothetical protein
MAKSIPGRRPSIDFPDGLSAGTPGLNDVKKGLSKPSWMGEEYGASEANASAKAFEGSFTTQDSPGLTRKQSLGSD